MSINRQLSQPGYFQEVASRQELREAFCSASAKYRREPRRPAQKAGHTAVHVTCHLCRFTFEHQVLRQVGTVSCPSCGVRFALKQQYQVDSVHIDQIEQELVQLRAEIEASHPQHSGNREKSVIGPLPMQTLKMSIDDVDNKKTENQFRNHCLDSTSKRIRSILVRLEKDQWEDYLQWRDSLRRHKSQSSERETSDRQPSFRETGKQPETMNADDVTNEYQSHRHNKTDVVRRSSFADDLGSLNRKKTRFRVKIAVAGIVFCGVFLAAIYTAKFVRFGNHSQPASRTTPVGWEELKPTQIIDTPQLSQINTERHASLDMGNFFSPAVMTPETPNMVIQAAISSSIPPVFVPEIPAPLPPVDYEAEQEKEMLASLDRQLQETQSQLNHVTQQYELSRQNNEHLERIAKQNEAESLFWEAYSNTGKFPVRSMILSLQAIERFKELELDIPNSARWVLNQSLALQNLGIPFNGFQGGVDAMALSKDGQWFLFAGNDGSVWLWDVSKHDLMSGCFPLDAIGGGVAQLLMTSDLHYGICVGRNGTIRIWNLKLDPKPSENPTDIVNARCHYTHVVVSEDGHWLAACGKPGRYENNQAVNDVYLWDLNHLTRNGTLGPPIVLKGHQKPIRSLTISGNSQWLVSGSEDQTVRVYDLKAAYPATEQIVLKGHELAVRCVAVSPDGRWLVTGGSDSILRIWDMQSRESMTVPIQVQEHEGWISALAFSADGRWLASGSYDNTIRIWRMDGVQQPNVVQVLSGHTGLIKSVEFSRQGNMLVSLGSDREVRLWNLEQGNPSENPLTFHCEQAPISSVTMTGDGKWLVLAQQKPNAATSSGLRLWPLVFDEAFDFAAYFAETRFPTLYQRRLNSVSPMMERQEERIARNSPIAQTGQQTPILSNHFGIEPTNDTSQPGDLSFIGHPLSGTWVPPFDGQANPSQSRINITMSPQSE